MPSLLHCGEPEEDFHARSGVPCRVPHRGTGGRVLLGGPRPVSSAERGSGLPAEIEALTPEELYAAVRTTAADLAAGRVSPKPPI
ncbi:hypothetical protein GCM10022221_01990 [Actinocorallia aurea]